MENETPFAVDADQDARLRAASTASNANNLRARNPAGQADKGDIQTHVHEETPLLSQWRAGGAGSTGDEDGVQLNTPWLGAKEFESKPWWRRPSVSLLSFPS